MPSVLCADPVLRGPLLTWRYSPLPSTQEQTIATGVTRQGDPVTKDEAEKHIHELLMDENPTFVSLETLPPPLARRQRGTAPGAGLRTRRVWWPPTSHPLRTQTPACGRRLRTQFAACRRASRSVDGVGLPKRGPVPLALHPDSHCPDSTVQNALVNLSFMGVTLAKVGKRPSLSAPPPPGSEARRAYPLRLAYVCPACARRPRCWAAGDAAAAAAGAGQGGRRGPHPRRRGQARPFPDPLPARAAGYAECEGGRRGASGACERC